jgi:hypothetical protein
MGCSRVSAKLSGTVGRMHGGESGTCNLFSVLCHLFSGSLLGRPGGDLLSRVLGRSTIGAEGFHGRVRDGIGCIAPRNDHQVGQAENRGQKTENRFLSVLGIAFWSLGTSMEAARLCEPARSWSDSDLFSVLCSLITVL